MIKNNITDEELDVLYNNPLDLFKWKCAVHHCQHYTKVWNIHGYNDANGNVYAWLRQGAMNWINPGLHFWLCAKHWPLFKKRKLTEDQLANPSKVIPLKQNVMKRKRFSIIQKLNK